MPTSMVPATMKRRILGTMPTAVMAPLRRDDRHGVSGQHSEASAPARRRAGCRSPPSAKRSIRPPRSWAARSLRARRRRWCRHRGGARRGRRRPALVNSACCSTNGVAARTPRTCANPRRHCGRRRAMPAAAGLKHEQVRVGGDDPVPDTVLEAGHDGQHDDQRGHAEEHTAHADPHEEREVGPLAARAQVAQPEEQLVRQPLPHEPGASGRRCGKRMTSRIDG